MQHIKKVQDFILPNSNRELLHRPQWDAKESIERIHQLNKFTMPSALVHNKIQFKREDNDITAIVTVIIYKISLYLPQLHSRLTESLGSLAGMLELSLL